MSGIFTSAFSSMELPGMAMVLVTVLFASVPATPDHSSVAAAQQRKLACSRTLWCCDRAPRGWQLFHLFLPWIMLLVLCMPCLSATGESTVTTQPERFQSSLQLSGGGIQVHEEAASVSRTVIYGSKDIKVDDGVASSNKGWRSVSALKDDGGSTQLSRSSEAGMYDSLAQEELLPALCMSPGWSHVWRAFLSKNFQTDSSTEITVQAFSVQEQHVYATLDWGPTRLTSVAYKVLTLTNRQSNTELRVSGILTSNAQFCTVDFQEVVLYPGSNMSILIAYIPNHIGKAEGSMLLQTSTCSFKLKNVGEGVPSLIKIQPASSLVVVSKAEWQETISLFNPFTEPVSIKEAYVWIESALNRTKGEGVLCRKVDFMPKCAYCSMLKVKPLAEWGVAPLSSTPVMDLSVIADDGEHLVGTLCLKIYRHSVHLSEVLVVPMKMHWFGLAKSSTNPFEKKIILQAEEAEEEDSGGAMFAGKAISWQVPVTGEFDSSPMTDMLTTRPMESLKLQHGVTKEMGANDRIGFSGGNTLRTSRKCYITEAFVAKKALRHLNSAVYPAFFVPCSALLRLFGNFGTNDIGKDRCLAKRLQCAENTSSQDSLNMPNKPCRVSVKVRGVANACEPEYVGAHISDGRHMPREYYMAVVMIISHCSNRSITGSSDESPKSMTCLVLFSPVDAEVQNECYEFSMLSLSVLRLESDCAWHSLASESLTHSWVACKLSDWSVSTDTERFKDNDSGLNKGPLKHHHREGDTDTSFMLQDGSSLRLQKVVHEILQQLELGNVNFCGSKNAGLCKEPAKPLDLLEFDYLERAVAGGWCEAHSFLVKDSIADKSLQVCHASLSFSKYQKFVLKFSLVILFLVFIVLVKLLRQEKFLMTDVRLRHSCSRTFFLHSVCLKTSYMKSTGRLSHFNQIPKKFGEINSTECSDDLGYENRFLSVLARVPRSVGFILRWVFDSQATILNVRVQIAESPCADQAPGNPRDSSLAKDRNCSMGQNFVEKPVSYQTSTSIQGTECIRCDDQSRLKFLEANTSSQIGLLTTHCDAQGFSQRPSSTTPTEDLELNFQLKEKKDKGKRRKKRNNIIDLKQESERRGQSASSSPPSSPASPATPLAYGSESPFLWSESTSRCFKGVSNSSRPQNNALCDPSCRRSSSIQFCSETSQLDVRGEHSYHNSTKKGTSQQLHNGLNTTSQLSVKPHLSGFADLSGKGSVRKDSPKDRHTGENWAAVARRAIATLNEPDQRQGFASSSRSSIKGVAQFRPVLLPSATFPQRGRSMQWSPRMLEKTNVVLSDPVRSPSLVSTSLVAPHARAPGSKPCSESLLGNNSGRATSQADRSDIDADLGVDDGSRNNEYLYDIWGDHFAEFSRTTRPNAFSRYANDTAGVALPVSTREESLFAASTRVLSYADAAVSPISKPSSAGFSIFSCDAFYSPSQQNDTTGSFIPAS